jgi:hypothetical protein
VSTQTQTTTLCICCGAVLTSGGRMCRDDVAALMADIRSCHDLLRELDTTLARLDKVTPPSAGGRSANVPMPYNVGASLAATELRGSIRSLQSALNGPGAASALDRFRRARIRAMEAVDIPDPRVFVGTCTCEAALYARTGESEVTCKVCRETWDAQPLDVWPEVRRLVGSVSTIRMWLLSLGVTRSRAQLYRDVARLDPVSEGGRAYRFADVLDGIAEAKTREPRTA